MRPAVVALSGLALGACTTPDVTPEISAATKLVAEVGAPLRSSLAAQANTDLREAEQRLIESGDIVLELQGCDPVEDADTFELLPDCRLVNYADPTAVAVNAYSVLAFADLVEGYYGALMALAATDSADAVQTRAAALFAALEAAGEGRSDALGALGAAAARNAGSVTRTAGFLAQQYRVTALRRVVRKADPLIAQGASTAAAYFDTPDSAMRQSQERMYDASIGADDAALAGDRAAQRRALDRLKAAHAAFLSAEAKSPATAFRLLARHHAALLARLTGSVRSDEVLQTLVQIDEILTALRSRS